MSNISSKTDLFLVFILIYLINTYPGPGVFGLLSVEYLSAIITDWFLGLVTSFGLYVEGPGVSSFGNY